MFVAGPPAMSIISLEHCIFERKKTNKQKLKSENTQSFLSPQNQSEGSIINHFVARVVPHCKQKNFFCILKAMVDFLPVSRLQVSRGLIPPLVPTTESWPAIIKDWNHAQTRE